MQTDDSEQMEGELRCEEEKNCSGWSLQGVYPKYVYAQTQCLPCFSLPSEDPVLSLLYTI